MTVKFSELCDKEVINCATGESLGFVSDIVISCEDGRVCELLVTPDGGGFSFKKETPISVPWDKIDRIGSDFIIVNGSFGGKGGEHKKEGFRMFLSK